MDAISTYSAAASKPGAASRVVFTASGRGCAMTVFEDKVEITPKGFLGLLERGLKSTKMIPFSSITSMQHKKAGFTVGYLQFGVKGSIDGRRGMMEAVKDENTFAYGSASDNPLVIEIKEYIESRMGHDSRLPAAAPTPGLSIADELRKLADLKDQGVLSSDEFDTAKRRLLLGT